MSKIDLDKLFRDKFLEQENSSKVYTPDRWKDFKKQLDKNLPADKKGGFRFNLNNLLIFIFSLVIIVMVPMLLLQSKGVDSSSGVSSRTLLTHTNTVSDKIISNKNRKEKQIEPSGYLTPAKIITFTQAADIPRVNNNQKETIIAKQNSDITDPEDAEVNITKIEKKEAVNINTNLLSNKIINEDSTSLNLKNSAGTSDTNMKLNKDGKRKKPKTIKRSAVLVPHVDYNGL